MARVADGLPGTQWNPFPVIISIETVLSLCFFVAPVLPLCFRTHSISRRWQIGFPLRERLVAWCQQPDASTSSWADFTGERADSVVCEGIGVCS